MSNPCAHRLLDAGYTDLGKLCRWLKVDLGALLGVSPHLPETSDQGMVVAHLKANREIAPAIASAPWLTQSSELSGVLADL